MWLWRVDRVGSEAYRFYGGLYPEPRTTMAGGKGALEG